MRCAELTLLVDESPAEVLDALAGLSGFAAHAPDVRSVAVTPDPRHPGESVSRWEVHFRSGTLRWSERDRVDRENLRIDFVQEDGDFQHFEGSWRLREIPSGCEIRFTARFDFGVASLAQLLDPAAERVLKDNVARALTGWFTGARPAGAVPAAAGRS
ncbi:type II toxin-antitoxin system RatA family toxin [Streptomyces angustmyceticus]